MEANGNGNRVSGRGDNPSRGAMRYIDESTLNGGINEFGIESALRGVGPFTKRNDTIIAILWERFEAHIDKYPDLNFQLRKCLFYIELSRVCQISFTEVFSDSQVYQRSHFETLLAAVYCINTFSFLEMKIFLKGIADVLPNPILHLLFSQICFLLNNSNMDMLRFFIENENEDFDIAQYDELFVLVEDFVLYNMAAQVLDSVLHQLYSRLLHDLRRSSH